MTIKQFAEHAQNCTMKNIKYQIHCFFCLRVITIKQVMEVK